MTAAASEIDSRWGEPPPAEARPAAILKGGPRGLEILVDAAASTDAIAAALTSRLEEAPGFFRGSDARVRIEGALPAGCLARLDEIATRFELKIVEIGPKKARAASGAAAKPYNDHGEPEGLDASAPVLQPALAVGTAPAAVAPVEAVPASESPVVTAAPDLSVEPTPETPAPAAVAPAAAAPAAAALAVAAPEKTRMVVGPVRSGVILDHPGNLVVLGDVNPGAEVRAEGNIVVLGRLRGIAHAGIGRDLGFIIALRLEPQQLRIGRLVARAGADGPGDGAEIAHVTDKSIVVERYVGKLPLGLAAGI